MRIELEKFFEEITPEYLEERRLEVSELRDLFSSEDIASLVEKFHQIAGSGGSYGLERISVLAREIEECLLEKNLPLAKTLYKDYISHLNEIVIVFKD